MGSMESEAASQLYWGSKLSRLSLTRSERPGTMTEPMSTQFCCHLNPTGLATSAARRVRVGAFGACFACCTPQPDPPCAVAATALAGQNVRRRTQQSRRTGGSAVKVPTASPQACAPPRAPPPALRFSRQKPPARARRISDLITDLLAPECPRKIRIKIWVHG